MARTPTPAHAAPRPDERKEPFDIDVVVERIAHAVRDVPKAAMFELAERGFGSPFEQLIACIISIRTRDETTLVAAERLFAAARTPEDLAKLPPSAIDRLIGDCTFHRPKSVQIHAIARSVVDDFGGELPCDYEALTAFKGVGPKCANLALGIGCGQATGVGVDIHVHRVTNRWGYVRAATPEKTMAALHAELPRRYWVRINALLVPFGKHVCTGVRPRCSTCPVRSMCRQVGVTDPR